MKISNRKGQNMAEYSILIALVIAAAIGMKLYVQRGIQARVHDESDQIGQAVATGSAKDWSTIFSGTMKDPATQLETQYEPDYFSKKATTVTSIDKEDYTLEKAGTTSKTVTKTTKQGDEDYEESGYTKK